MFKLKLENILGGFTKVKEQLKAFVEQAEIEGKNRREEISVLQEVDAALTSEKQLAEKVLGKISTLLGA